MLRRVAPWLLTLVVFGCSRNPQPVASSGPSPTRDGAPPAYEPEYRSDSRGDSPSHESAARPPSPGASSSSTYDDRARRSEADSAFRPGLATSWGEQRTSPIWSTAFERRDPSHPTAWAEIRYDDESGIQAAVRSQWLSRQPHRVPLLGGALLVSIVDGGDDPLPSVFSRDGSYVIAEPGERYQIHVENESSVRFEIVATVDGLDVLDGRPGSLEKRGYLVGPGEELLIDGFRTSERDVAAFRFGRVHESYAAARGSTANVGVIGVAAFEEGSGSWAPPPGVGPRYDEEAERRRRADPFPGRFAPAPH